MSELRAEVDSVLGQFGDKIGLPNLALDEHNNCALCFDDGMVVDLELVSSALVLFTELGLLTEVNRLEICETFLEANLFWNGTDGATVGLNRVSDSLLLCDKAPADTLCLEGFETFLNRFITTAEAWTNALDAFHAAPMQIMKTMPKEDGAIRV